MRIINAANLGLRDINSTKNECYIPGSNRIRFLRRKYVSNASSSGNSRKYTAGCKKAAIQFFFTLRNSIFVIDMPI
jgi:hypothetical protein